MLFNALQTVVLISSLVARQAFGQRYYGPEDPRVKVELTLQTPTNGVSLTPDGRLFIVWSRIDGSTGPQLAEYDRSTNTSKAYPNKEWNSYKTGDNPATHFLGVNSQRIGPDGNLWVVDKGATGFSTPVILPDGPKVVVIDIKTNKVARTYLMGNVTDSKSLLDDIRFHNSTGKAYLTDAGSPGLIVLDLATGHAVRVLNNQLSTREYIAMSAEGSLMHEDGKPVYFYADQLEVSPDGKWFYYQPATGGMSRIETKWMDAAFSNSSLAESNAILGQYVQPYAHTPATGGTSIDAEGNVYNSDVDSQRILKISPNGTMSTLVQDPRLLWVDAMWIDDKKRLWMPTPQLNRGVPFNNGKNRIIYPLHVFSIYIGVGPSPIDHA